MNRYDKEIDDLFNFLLENMISYIEPQIKENGHKFPKTQNVKKGQNMFINYFVN